MKLLLAMLVVVAGSVLVLGLGIQAAYAQEDEFARGERLGYQGADYLERFTDFIYGCTAQVYSQDMQKIKACNDVFEDFNNKMQDIFSTHSNTINSMRN